MAVDTLPDGFPAIPILATADGDELYAFLEAVFDARLLDRYGPDGQPTFMTIGIGDSVLSVMHPGDGSPTRSAMYVYVGDVDSVYERAMAAGAVSMQAPVGAIHGDRMATFTDLFGNHWTIATRIEQISVDELHRRLANSDPS